jgi:hypothetical protein
MENNITSLIFNLGVATWCTDIITVIPTAITPTIQVGKTLPSDVGFIYGISTYVDGLKDADGNTLPTTTQGQNLFLTLQTGSTQFMSQIRLTDFSNELSFGGGYQIRDSIFRPVNIPAFDLSKSYYQNPASIVSSLTTIAIRLKLWYIQEQDWTRVKEVMKHHSGVNTHFHKQK